MENQEEVTEQLAPGEHIRVLFEGVDSLKSAKNRIVIELQQDLNATDEEAIQASERSLCIAYNLHKGWDYLLENGSLDGFITVGNLRNVGEEE